jgi:hypothetical protein
MRTKSRVEEHHHPARSAAGGWRRGTARVPAMRRETMVPADSQRLFACHRCSAQVVICRRCDRGNRYCGEACARAARSESQRASNRRYQATPRGRNLHAERQARYARRKCSQAATRKQPVTEHSSARDASAVRLPVASACRTCGAPRTTFLRLYPDRANPGGSLEGLHVACPAALTSAPDATGWRLDARFSTETGAR